MAKPIRKFFPNRSHAVRKSIRNERHVAVWVRKAKPVEFNQAKPIQNVIEDISYEIFPNRASERSRFQHAILNELHTSSFTETFVELATIQTRNIVITNPIVADTPNGVVVVLARNTGRRTSRHQWKFSPRDEKRTLRKFSSSFTGAQRYSLKNSDFEIDQGEKRRPDPPIRPKIR